MKFRFALVLLAVFAPREKLSKLILLLLIGQGGDVPGKGLDMKALWTMLLLDGDEDDALMTMLLQNGGLLGR